MNSVQEKNKKSWDDFSDAYSRTEHAEERLQKIVENPSSAFHHTVWEQLQRYLPDLKGKRICVPSSGNIHAVFVFALLGAQVTSCDLSEKQLKNAALAAEKLGIRDSIEFVCSDTMKLEGVQDSAYDLVYTSNGVHVWISDLEGMYRNIHRIMKPGALYLLYEIHPFQRPFDDSLKVVKPYDWTGPFEGESEITFAWRIQDILNALLDSGLRLKHFEELLAEKDYEDPFWIPMEAQVKGVTATREEVDRMYDWRHNPAAALPNYMCMVGRKEGKRG